MTKHPEGNVIESLSEWKGEFKGFYRKLKDLVNISCTAVESDQVLIGDPVWPQALLLNLRQELWAVDVVLIFKIDLEI